MKIFLNKPFYRPIQPENFILKKFVFALAVLFCNPMPGDHIIDTGVCCSGYLWLLPHDLNIVRERTFPIQALLFAPVLPYTIKNIHRHPPLRDYAEDDFFFGVY